MEPTDSRLQATSPEIDEAPVVFDMVSLDHQQNAARSAASSIDDGLAQRPLDAVAGVEPNAETPLSSPAVHTPVGDTPSQLESALRDMTAPPAPSAPSAPMSAPAAVPAASAFGVDPALSGASPTAGSPAPPPPPPPPPVPPISLSSPPAQATMDDSTVDSPSNPIPVAVVAAAAAAPPEIRVNRPNGLSLPAPRADAYVASAEAMPIASADIEQLPQLPMLPVRVLAVGGTATALAASAWQAARVINEQDRLASLSMLALIAAILGAIGVVLWTWIVTENVRRVVAPARTQEPPSPGHAAMTWLVPMAFIAGAAAAVTYLSAELNTPSDGTQSSLPLLIALAAIVLSIPLMYSPVTYLSGVVRKVGGRGVRFAEWIWVPVVLSIVGVAMMVGLRLGGAFGEDFDGIAPAWVIGVVAIVPAVVVVALGWRAAAAVEADVVRAFDRRLGRTSKLPKSVGPMFTLSADGGPNQAALRQRGFINQLPGTRFLSVAILAGLAGLGLLSLIGALVVFMFWQETRDGVLVPAQSDRAWDLVATLHSLERNIWLALIVLASVWTFVAVTNIRLASARRRNPVLAAAAWPAASFGIWTVGDRLVADGSAADVIVGFAAQALLLAVPVFLLYRGAGSIGARRHMLRMTWAFGVVLLVHVQGLGGLSTADITNDSTAVARLAGYLAIGALVQLLTMFAAAGAMSAMTDTTSQVAMRHNAAVAQRLQPEMSPVELVSAPRLNESELEGAMRE